jgi:hypothetical protein
VNNGCGLADCQIQEKFTRFGLSNRSFFVVIFGLAFGLAKTEEATSLSQQAQINKTLPLLVPDPLLDPLEVIGKFFL